MRFELGQILQVLQWAIQRKLGTRASVSTENQRKQVVILWRSSWTSSQPPCSDPPGDHSSQLELLSQHPLTTSSHNISSTHPSSRQQSRGPLLSSRSQCIARQYHTSFTSSAASGVQSQEPGTRGQASGVRHSISQQRLAFIPLLVFTELD